MNIRQELKSLDVKLQKLKEKYYKGDKKRQARYLERIYNSLQNSFIELEVNVEEANFYFEDLLEEMKK